MIMLIKKRSKMESLVILTVLAAISCVIVMLSIEEESIWAVGVLCITVIIVWCVGVLTSPYIDHDRVTNERVTPVVKVECVNEVCDTTYIYKFRNE